LIIVEGVRIMWMIEWDVDDGLGDGCGSVE
jgi:hypothetical protein